jgi:hypothetical protein
MGKTNSQLIRHLRRSRHYAKEILNVTSQYGSAIISHKVEVKTPINDNETLISTIEMLPDVRLYRRGNTKIVNDENLLNEDVEDSRWD